MGIWDQKLGLWWVRLQGHPFTSSCAQAQPLGPECGQGQASGSARDAAEGPGLATPPSTIHSFTNMDDDVPSVARPRECASLPKEADRL